MDIYCPICREPCDRDELHDTGWNPAGRARRYMREVMPEAIEAARQDLERESRYDYIADKDAWVATRARYYAMLRTFRRYGCEALGTSHNT